MNFIRFNDDDLRFILIVLVLGVLVLAFYIWSVDRGAGLINMLKSVPHK